MPNTYKNVSEMAKDLLDSDSQKELEDTIYSKRLSKLLFSLRCSAGRSQEELANQLGCTQSRISKIENSPDGNLKIKDLIDYADALKLQLHIGYANKNRTSVDSIKYHAFKIKEHLDKLADLAKGDDDLFEGISGFFGEYFFNMLNLFNKSLMKLEPYRKQTRETVHITSPIDIHQEKLATISSLAPSQSTSPHTSYIST